MLFRILLALIILYLVFLVLPTIIVYFLIFRRRTGRSIRNLDYRGTYYEAWLPFMEEGFETLEKLPFQEVSAKGKDGTRLSGLYLDRGFSRTVLLFHGFRSAPFQDFWCVSKEFLSREYNLLFVYERAHGKSGGQRSTLGIKEAEDVLSWTDFCRDCLGQKELLLYGVSMGGAAVGFASDRLPKETVKGLILDAAYVSPDDQIGRTCKKLHLPGKLMQGPLRVLLKLDQGINFTDRCSAHLSKTEIPVLFLYGKADSTVPVSDFTELFESCHSKKTVIEAESGEHTLAFPSSGEEGKKILSGFLEDCFRTGQ